MNHTESALLSFGQQIYDIAGHFTRQLVTTIFHFTCDSHVQNTVIAMTTDHTNTPVFPRTLTASKIIADRPTSRPYPNCYVSPHIQAFTQPHGTPHTGLYTHYSSHKDLRH